VNKLGEPLRCEDDYGHRSAHYNGNEWWPNAALGGLPRYPGKIRHMSGWHWLALLLTLLSLLGAIIWLVVR